jgi:hypothetical protein
MSALAPAVRELLDDRLMPLGPGIPNAAVRDRLRNLTPETLFISAAVKNFDFAKACLSGVWLLHDFLDEAHALSQDIDTAEGSWWHGIVHRREPDYGNSKYWFRRVGRHPAFATLNERLTAHGLPAWDAMAFVDQCQRASVEGGDLEGTCREIQREEWRVLFEYCAHHAV